MLSNSQQEVPVAGTGTVAVHPTRSQWLKLGSHSIAELINFKDVWQRHRNENENENGQHLVSTKPI